jgi:DNA-binding transcriptional MerR regulator
MDQGNEMAIIRLRLVSPASEAPYTIDELARLGGVPPALVQRYLEDGLLEPVAGHPRTSWFFDENALFELRRMERLRRELGVNLAGVAVIHDLLQQIEELKADLNRLKRESM